MIKNDALDEIYDLNYRWKCLIEDLFEDEFDYEFFKYLAVHTFAFLFPYHSAENIPRDVLGVLFKIKEFAECPIKLSCQNVSRANDAAQLVAQSFCIQMQEQWICINQKYSEDEFMVLDDCGKHYIIDTDTFDLSEIIDDI